MHWSIFTLHGGARTPKSKRTTKANKSMHLCPICPRCFSLLLFLIFSHFGKNLFWHGIQKPAGVMGWMETCVTCLLAMHSSEALVGAFLFVLTVICAPLLEGRKMKGWDAQMCLRAEFVFCLLFGICFCLLLRKIPLAGKNCLYSLLRCFVERRGRRDWWTIRYMFLR